MTTTNFDSAPPLNQISPVTWVKKNLFSNLFNSILTIVSVLLIFWFAFNLINWAFTQAQWTVLQANFRLFFVGRYPIDQLWRVWLVLGIIVSVGGISWGILSASSALFHRSNLITLAIVAACCMAVALPAGITTALLLLGMLLLFVVSAFGGKQIKKFSPSPSLPLVWLLSFFVILWLLQGGWFLKPVKLDDLSGLILTILAALVSIVLCFPFGVLLALGRQSELPLIRWLSIAYIEIIRGLPLIGILFMAQVMLPLVLPSGFRVDRVVRAIAGFTIFSSAYLAENVRGGLQSIPRGQYEAAKALGLNPALSVLLIVLPQALRAVIPSIVGQFISLFKDTSLLAIVGLVDLLGISRSILANPKYIGRYAEVYLFIAVIYFIFCSCMSVASKKLESSRM